MSTYNIVVSIPAGATKAEIESLVRARLVEILADALMDVPVNMDIVVRTENIGSDVDVIRLQVSIEPQVDDGMILEKV